MSAKGQRFANRVVTRMLEVNRRTHDSVKAAGGPSSPIMSKILGGDAESVSLNSLDKLEVALELRPGSAAASLTNDTELEPVPGSRVYGDSLAEIQTRLAELAELVESMIEAPTERRGRLVRGEGEPISPRRTSPQP